MNEILGSKEGINLRQEIISQCLWSETYSSLKHILKRTANRLPLLISFHGNDDQQETTHKNQNNYETIFFFDRSLSNKLSFTPLQQTEEKSDHFIIYPEHCTFIMPELFKGIFEFVLNGVHRSRIYLNLEKLINSSSNLQPPIIFMSRDRVLAHFHEANSSQWSNKKYPQGAIFQAKLIHRSSVVDETGHKIPNDYLECIDEDGYNVLIKMDQSGRFSVIATSAEQRENQPEIYLHSTQTSNIDQFINKIILTDNDGSNKNCIRLVRGPVPHNFQCQYFNFIRQHKHDLLVGLTQEGLVVEWNLESHVPCRYATNLDDILGSIYGTETEQTLEYYVDQARTHYKDNFQHNIQLMSSYDWTAFFQYWKWIGTTHKRLNGENKITYQSRHRFHLLASVQDLSDYSRLLISLYKKNHDPFYYSFSSKHDNSSLNKQTPSSKQRSLFSQMSKFIASPSSSRKHHHKDRLTQRASTFILQNDPNPFDNSIYDSNQIRQPSSDFDSINRSKRKSRRI